MYQKISGYFKLNAMDGYSQVPGIDFQEAFAPGLTFCILLIIMLTWSLKGICTETSKKQSKCRYLKE
jgi:hypothetical protein